MDLEKWPQLLQDFALRVQTEEPSWVGLSQKIRYVRVKDVGSRLSPGELRNRKIIALAKPLPEDNRLLSRAVYWFVTQEEVALQIGPRKNSCLLKESAQQSEDGGITYYLFMVHFRSQIGYIQFVFADGLVQFVYSAGDISSQGPRLQLETDQQIALMNNNNAMMDSYASFNDPSNSMVLSVPVVNELVASVINTLILVPNEDKWLKEVSTSILFNGFTMQNTESEQRLYVKKLPFGVQHIVVFPYASVIDQEGNLENYVSVASHVIWLLEDAGEHCESVTIQINNCPYPVNDTLGFTSVPVGMKEEIEYAKLMPSIQNLLKLVFEQRKSFIGFILNKASVLNILQQPFFNSHRPLRQHSFLCFKFEVNNNKTLAEYATDVEEATAGESTCNAVSAMGCVLIKGAIKAGVHVYLQCPSYTPWYILQRKDHIFDELAYDGLIEISSCTLSDVEEVMQLPDNQQHQQIIEGLVHLREQFYQQTLGLTEPETHSKFKITFESIISNFTRVSQEESKNSKSRIRYIRMKDVGTRLASPEQRNKRIIELADSLPADRRLNPRAIYWFLTTEEAIISFHDTKLFTVNEQTRVVDDSGVTHHLTCIDFKRNKRGSIEFKFSNGDTERIFSSSSSSSSKRPVFYKSPSPMQVENPTKPQEQLGSNALIVNILLLVPEKDSYIQMVDKTMCNIGFTKEALSPNQSLYSHRNLNNIQRHVLLCPYGRINRLYHLKDCLQCTNEVILLIENEDDQEDPVTMISGVTNNYSTNNWTFTTKSSSFRMMDVDYARLNQLVKILLSITELRDVTLGCLSCKKSLSYGDLCESFATYFLQWTLGSVEKRVAQNIFLCFKYEPELVTALTEYAATTFDALGIRYNLEGFEQISCPPTLEKLPADKRKVLAEKHSELKKFDNKWTKTVEECYDSDKLRQQLFNFQTKNTKIAVRVFLSSASVGLATNVAKLMRQFRGKSIVDGVHAGLQIGNTIIEWNQSGLVHIGELKHGNAVAVLFESARFEYTEDIATKMINFIQQWNVERQYSTKENNSHRFVRDFLQYTMNMSLIDRFKGPLGSYMDHMMKTGDATPRLISKTLGTMVFKSHKELEDKDRDIRDKLNEDELKLLKIFHRGFQLQEAANGQDVSSCCYGLPTNGLEILNDSGKPMQ